MQNWLNLYAKFIKFVQKGTFFGEI